MRTLSSLVRSMSDVPRSDVEQSRAAHGCFWLPDREVGLPGMDPAGRMADGEAHCPVAPCPAVEKAARSEGEEGRVSSCTVCKAAAPVTEAAGLTAADSGDASAAAVACGAAGDIRPGKLPAGKSQVGSAALAAMAVRFIPGRTRSSSESLLRVRSTSVLADKRVVCVLEIGSPPTCARCVLC